MTFVILRTCAMELWRYRCGGLGAPAGKTKDFSVEMKSWEIKRFASLHVCSKNKWFLKYQNVNACFKGCALQDSDYNASRHIRFICLLNFFLHLLCSSVFFLLFEFIHNENIIDQFFPTVNDKNNLNCHIYLIAVISLFSECFLCTVKIFINYQNES